MNLADLFQNYEESAFRLEGLPAYKVDEETEALDHFARHGTVPVDFNSEWSQLVAKNVGDGKTMSRLRLLSEPLTTYEAFELEAYKPGINAGEDIRLQRRSNFPQFVEDFWLFDERWIAKMNYRADGSWVSADVVEASDEQLTTAREWINAFSKAEPLH
ncbi:DUF6879 family protein [Agreia sp. VKM Ac-1783]|uniref:DUF6879 family protein n=1 Tax=Agreia sp. VKM Ac-1783 TaxID=1938889 RepID=UPI000A2AC8B3|nr:DUF6879 family protein [Agreia sp. VKM Ac-1783]SMQ71892.1 hypothetical protein SAMN06295943_2778 [Agreia sp. VKM Ac-1783]